MPVEIRSKKSVLKKLDCKGNVFIEISSPLLFLFWKPLEKVSSKIEAHRFDKKNMR